MNDHLNLVEPLIEKTGVSYSEAKTALESCSWDLLDAIVLLEQQGKTDRVKSAQYSTRKERIPLDEAHTAHNDTRRENKENARQNLRRLGDWLAELVRKGNRNQLIVQRRDGSEVISIPVTAFVLLLIISAGTVLGLMFVSLFFGYGFRFEGKDLGKESINSVMEKAEETADSIKQGLQDQDENNAK